jgi:DNA-binding transcriptional ArsR family regulator
MSKEVRMSGNNGQVIDQRLVKAVSHPLRVEVLEAIISQGEVSPTQVATNLGQELGKVSYHVNVLKDCEVIELVRTRQRRGALEHFFRPAPSMREFIDLAKSTFS